MSNYFDLRSVFTALVLLLSYFSPLYAEEVMTPDPSAGAQKKIVSFEFENLEFNEMVETKDANTGLITWVDKQNAIPALLTGVRFGLDLTRPKTILGLDVGVSILQMKYADASLDSIPFLRGEANAIIKATAPSAWIPFVFIGPNIALAPHSPIYKSFGIGAQLGVGCLIGDHFSISANHSFSQFERADWPDQVSIAGIGAKYYSIQGKMLRLSYEF